MPTRLPAGVGDHFCFLNFWNYDPILTVKLLIFTCTCSIRTNLWVVNNLNFFVFCRSQCSGNGHFSDCGILCCAGYSNDTAIFHNNLWFWCMFGVTILLYFLMSTTYIGNSSAKINTELRTSLINEFKPKDQTIFIDWLFYVIGFTAQGWRSIGH